MSKMILTQSSQGMTQSSQSNLASFAKTFASFALKNFVIHKKQVN
jgi:hypothetical protein